ncbi:protein AMN1 homolog [Stigmatopora nigra]
MYARWLNGTYQGQDLPAYHTTNTRALCLGGGASNTQQPTQGSYQTVPANYFANKIPFVQPGQPKLHPQGGHQYHNKVPQVTVNVKPAQNSNNPKSITPYIDRRLNQLLFLSSGSPRTPVPVLQYKVKNGSSQVLQVGVFGTTTLSVPTVNSQTVKQVTHNTEAFSTHNVQTVTVCKTRNGPYPLREPRPDVCALTSAVKSHPGQPAPLSNRNHPTKQSSYPDGQAGAKGDRSNVNRTYARETVHRKTTKEQQRPLSAGYLNTSQSGESAPPSTAILNDCSNTARVVAVVQPLSPIGNVTTPSEKSPGWDRCQSVKSIRLAEKHPVLTQFLKEAEGADLKVPPAKASSPQALEKEGGVKKEETPILTQPQTSDMSSLKTENWTATSLALLIETLEEQAGKSNSNAKSISFKQAMNKFWNSGSRLKQYCFKEAYNKILLYSQVFFHALKLSRDSVVFSHVDISLAERLKNVQVLKDGEVYKEAPPYTSSWKNQNEALDDIDKDFGPNIYYKPPRDKEADPLQKVPDPLQKVSDPLQKVPDPLQKVPDPLQKVPDPLQNVPDPLQNVPDPLQKVPDPLQIVPHPLQKVPDPLQKVPDPLQKVPDPLQKVLDVPPQTVDTTPGFDSETMDEESHDPLYSIEIQVLHPEEAKAIFEKGCKLSQSPQSIGQPEELSHISDALIEETPQDLQVQRDSNDYCGALIEEPFQDVENSNTDLSIQEFCCIEKWKEIILGCQSPLEQKCRCREDRSDKSQQINSQQLSVFHSVDGNTESTSEETVFGNLSSIKWHPKCNEGGETFELLDDNEMFEEPEETRTQIQMENNYDISNGDSTQIFELTDDEMEEEPEETRSEIQCENKYMISNHASTQTFKLIDNEMEEQPEKSRSEIKTENKCDIYNCGKTQTIELIVNEMEERPEKSWTEIKTENKYDISNRVKTQTIELIDEMEETQAEIVGESKSKVSNSDVIEISDDSGDDFHQFDSQPTEPSQSTENPNNANHSFTPNQAPEIQGESKNNVSAGDVIEISDDSGDDFHQVDPQPTEPSQSTENPNNVDDSRTPNQSPIGISPVQTWPLEPEPPSGIKPKNPDDKPPPQMNERKRKKMNHPNSLLPGLKKLINKKKHDSYKAYKAGALNDESVESSDRNTTVATKKTVRLNLFGFLQREKQYCSSYKAAPPEVIYAQVETGTKRKGSKSAPKSAKSPLFETLIEVHGERTTIRHGKCSSRKDKKAVSVPRDQITTDDGSQSSVSENVLNFTVLPKSFNFKDASASQKRTAKFSNDGSSSQLQAPSPCKKSRVESWRSFPAKKSFSTSKKDNIFAEYRKKYKNGTQ